MTDKDDELVIDMAEEDAKEDAKSDKNAHKQAGEPGAHRNVWQWCLAHKLITIPVAVLIVLGVLAAVPTTRFMVAGLFWKQTLPVAVVDSQTNKPVTNAQLVIDGKTFETNAAGVANPKVAVGVRSLAISKKYYKSISVSVTVPILRAKHPVSLKMVATGRQVPITVVNTISGELVANAQITTADTKALTGKAGQVTMVLPADKNSVSATITGDGYNSASVSLTVTAKTVAANTFKITPSGKLYFLSNATGKIDVVKTNLDGTDRQTVVAGTGSEAPDNTVLLASKDWKYLALYSIRKAGAPAEINLIDTANGDKMTNVDTGSNASFSLVGWQGHSLIYVVSRDNYNAWQPGAVTLKSFNAETAHISALYTTAASGTSNSDAQYESVFASGVRLLGNKVVFSTLWYKYPGYLQNPGKQNILYSINADGTGKKSLAILDANTTYVGNIIPYEPDELVVQISSINGDTPATYYAYGTDGGYNKTNAPSQDVLFGNYPTFLASPSDKQVFWAEQRDGKNLLQIGDNHAEKPVQIASASDYNTYGWYTDRYLLVSKNSSELYILPAAPLASGQSPLKISNYYKPAVNFNGYGGGYGGR